MVMLDNTFSELQPDLDNKFLFTIHFLLLQKTGKQESSTSKLLLLYVSLLQSKCATCISQCY